MATDRSAAAEKRRLRREQRREAVAKDGRRNGRASGNAQRVTSDLVSGVAEVPKAIVERVRSEISNVDPSWPPLPDLRMSQVGTGTAVAVGAILGLAGAAKVARMSQEDGNTVSGEVAVHLLNKIELLTIRLQVRQARSGLNSDRLIAFDVHRADSNLSKNER